MEKKVIETSASIPSVSGGCLVSTTEEIYDASAFFSL